MSLTLSHLAMLRIVGDGLPRRCACRNDIRLWQLPASEPARQSVFFLHRGIPKQGLHPKKYKNGHSNSPEGLSLPFDCAWLRYSIPRFCQKRGRKIIVFAAFRPRLAGFRAQTPCSSPGEVHFVSIRFLQTDGCTVPAHYEIV